MTMTAAQPKPTGASGYTALLPCVPESVSRARALVAGVLASWGLEDDLADCGKVIVSELLTNAINHTSTPRTTLSVERREDHTVRITVHDTSHVVPQATEADSDAECGRGLRLVDALSWHWGYDIARHGKVVWADLKVVAVSDR